MKNTSRRKLTVRAGVLLLAVVLCLFAFDVRLRTVEYTVEIPAVEHPVRLALITDLHSCRYGEGQHRLLNALDEAKPDAVLLGGDIFDDVLDNSNAEEFIRLASEKYACFYVTGNHEYWSCSVDSMLEYVSACGVTALSGTCAQMEINGQRINICGVDDPENEFYTDAVMTVSQQLDACAQAAQQCTGECTVLLAHRPELIDDYRLQGCFDVVLSGHAHGGQWRIPGILNGLFAPHQGLFPEYAGGMYTFSDTVMIVSRGLARESTRVPRVFNRPELVIVELV